MSHLAVMFERFSRKTSHAVPWQKWHHPYFWLATSFGAGLTPLRGPAGALVALPLAAYLYSQGGPLLVWLATIFIIWIGINAATWWENETGGKDSSPIVIDETAGMMIGVSILPLPTDGFWLYWIIAYFAFVIIDYLKPYPLKKLENLPRGHGVMWDDVAAGVYTLILMIVILVLPAAIMASSAA